MLKRAVHGCLMYCDMRMLLQSLCGGRKLESCNPPFAGGPALSMYHNAECSGQPLHPVLSMHGVFGIALIQPSATWTHLFIVFTLFQLHRKDLEPCALGISFSCFEHQLLLGASGLTYMGALTITYTIWGFLNIITQNPILLIYALTLPEFQALVGGCRSFFGCVLLARLGFRCPDRLCS